MRSISGSKNEENMHSRPERKRYIPGRGKDRSKYRVFPEGWHKVTRCGVTLKVGRRPWEAKIEEKLGLEYEKP